MSTAGPKTLEWQRTWNALVDESIAFSGGDIADKDAQKRLSQAAIAYARAHAAVNPAKPTTSDMTLRFGREKGVPLRNMKTGNLKWARDFLSDKIGQGSDERWHDSNVEQHAAIVAELEFRGDA